MPIVSLRDLYIAELRDLYDAEQQIVQELPAMASKATSKDLRDALDHHLNQTRTHVQRLELIFQQLGLSAAGEPCEAIRGLVAEGRRRLGNCERGDVLDAAIIGMAQRVEHYEIAGYGCARTYARTLGESTAVDLLQQTLDEEGKTDHRLTALAERGINHAAGEDLPTGDPRVRSRLRYIDVSDLREFPHRGFRVANESQEDLGVLEGFIVERHSGRPIYYVVDSGGWFVGRRYLVPIGMLRADESACALRTHLTRETIHRYPEFNASAFLSMSDEEAHRYEHRLLSVVAPELARRGVTPEYDDLPEYRPPTWLMTGVWMTDGIGLSAVPPRASSDLDELRRQAEAPPGRTPARQDYPENELMMARGEREESVGPAAPTPDSGEVRARETEQPKTTDPRLERYRER